MFSSWRKNTNMVIFVKHTQKNRLKLADPQVLR